MSDKPKWEKYGGEKKPTMKRRCTEHDYYDRSIYMITMATEGRRQLFGQIEGNSNCEKEAVSVKLSAMGERVKECWDNIADYYPQVEPMKLCIMPDHIHGLLFVHEKMNSHLGKVIAGFKTGTRKAARELGILPALIAQDTEQTAEQPTATAEQPAATAEQPTTAGGQPTTAGPSAAVPYTALPAQSAATPSRHTAAGRAHGTLWEPNYHDRLLRGRNQLQRMITYMDENPYLRWIKQQHPEYSPFAWQNEKLSDMRQRCLLLNSIAAEISK